MVGEKATRTRSCIGCGARKDKGALHRVVRAKDGAVFADPTGKAGGRGAYVCSSACLSKALKTRKLARALRVTLTEDDYVRIEAELARAMAAGAGKTEE